MRPLTLIPAFAPQIVFSVLAIGPSWPPKLLFTGSLMLFAAIALLGSTLGPRGQEWLATWGGTGFGLAVGTLIPVVPVTSPTFRRVNRVVSAGWGVAILAAGACRVAAATIGQNASRRLAELLLDPSVPVAIILGALRFSHCYCRSIQGKDV